MLDRTNRELTKLNPLEWPRDPKPAPLTPIYRLGEVEPFFHICTAPRIFGRYVPINWSEKQRLIAVYFQCDPDDIASYELDDGAELIAICGNVVGSFDRPVSLTQLAAAERAELTDGSR